MVWWHTIKCVFQYHEVWLSCFRSYLMHAALSMHVAPVYMDDWLNVNSLFHPLHTTSQSMVSYFSFKKNMFTGAPYQMTCNNVGKFHLPCMLQISMLLLSLLQNPLLAQYLPSFQKQIYQRITDYIMSMCMYIYIWGISTSQTFVNLYTCEWMGYKYNL